MFFQVGMTVVYFYLEFKNDDVFHLFLADWNWADNIFQ